MEVKVEVPAVKKASGLKKFGFAAAAAAAGGAFVYQKMNTTYDHAASEAAFLSDWSEPPPWPVFSKMKNPKCRFV